MTTPIRTDTPLEPVVYDRRRTTEVWECLRPRGLTGPDERRCPLCQTVKPLTAFHRSTNDRAGRHCYCAPCRNAYESNRRKQGKAAA